MIVTETDEWKIPFVALPLNQAFPEAENDKLPDRGIAEFQKYKTKKVILSEDRSRVFGVFGPRRQLVKHEDFVNAIDESISKLVNNDVPVVVSSFDDGARIRVDVELPDEEQFRFDVGNNDKSRLQLVCFNSYDGRYTFKINIGVYRMVCENGMIVGDDIASLKTNQLFSAMTEKTLSKRISSLLDESSKLVDVWKEWMRIGIPKQVGVDLLSQRFPKKAVDAMKEGNWPQSKYSLYQDMTAYASHKTTTLSAQTTMDSLIQQSFYSKRGIFNEGNILMAMEELDELDNALKSGKAETDDITH